MDLFNLIMKKITFLFLLLATIFLINAHAKNEYNKTITNTYTITIPTFIKNASSLTLDLTKDEYNNIERNDVDDDAKSYNINRKDLLKSNKKNIIGDSEYDTQKTYSVVQDWHLVCKQLCGAGLGGPTCGIEPTCNEIKDEAKQKYNITAKANRLLEDNAEPICQDLCKYQLGDEICACSKRVYQTSDNESIDIDVNDSNIWGRNQICHTFCQYNEITITGCSICSKDIHESTNDIETKTKIIPTTPNWEKVCKELCKSGDGGSLCNCDKPPFF